MRSFNDAGLTYRDAIRLSKRTIKIPMSEVTNLIPWSFLEYLREAPRGFYSRRLGILPIFEEGMDYYVSIGNGLEKTKDVQSSIIRGEAIMDRDGRLMISEGECRQIMGNCPELRFKEANYVASDFARGQTVQALFGAGYIHAYLSELVMGRDHAFAHLFSAAWSGQTFGSYTLIGPRINSDVKAMPDWDSFFHEDIPEIDRFGLHDRKLSFFMEIIDPISKEIGIGSQFLPTINTIVNSNSIQIEIGLDLRIIDSILTRENEAEEEERRRSGEI